MHSFINFDLSDIMSIDDIVDGCHLYLGGIFMLGRLSLCIQCIYVAANLESQLV